MELSVGAPSIRKMISVTPRRMASNVTLEKFQFHLYTPTLILFRKNILMGLSEKKILGAAELSRTNFNRL